MYRDLLIVIMGWFVVKKIEKPIFFFQAENDYDLSPSKELYSDMIKAGKVAYLKIYPIFGKSAKEGHSFPYRGASIWFKDVYSFINKYCPEYIYLEIRQLTNHYTGVLLRTAPYKTVSSIVKDTDICNTASERGTPKKL